MLRFHTPMSTAVDKRPVCKKAPARPSPQSPRQRHDRRLASGRVSARSGPYGAAALVGIFGVAVLVACGDAEPSASCVPNETQSCTVGAQSGSQVCLPAGVWGGCDVVNSERTSTASESSDSDRESPNVATTEQSDAPVPRKPTGAESTDTDPVSPNTDIEPPDTNPPPPPAPPGDEAPTCFDGGDIESVGCGDAGIECCAGSVCIDNAELNICAATCLSGSDCVSGCCTALAGASAAVCAAAENCLPPPPPPGETFELTGVERSATDLYSARSGANDLYIETRSCSESASSDDGLLIIEDAGDSRLFIEGSGICDVTDLYFADTPFGTYDLTRVDRAASNVYRAQIGGSNLVIETRLCLALTLPLDKGILIWQGIGSQLFFDNGSGDVCDAADVYVN